MYVVFLNARMQNKNEKAKKEQPLMVAHLERTKMSSYMMFIRNEKT